jgi:transcriptional regulator with XRE-family HTH domain
MCCIKYFTLNAIILKMWFIVHKNLALIMEFKEVGLAVTAFRRGQKLSQQHIAEATGLSRATINVLETGRAGDVGLRKVIKVIDFLGYEIQLKEKSKFPTLEELRDD